MAICYYTPLQVFFFVVNNLSKIQPKQNIIIDGFISLCRLFCREVWPENNCFGSNNMAPEEEFLALRDIFFADLGGKSLASEILINNRFSPP